MCCYYETIVIPFPKISPYTYTNILWLPEIQISKQFYPKKLEWRISNLSCLVYNRCWLAITWLDELISSWLWKITAWLSSKWKHSTIFRGQCKLIRRNRQWCRTDRTAHQRVPTTQVRGLPGKDFPRLLNHWTPELLHRLMTTPNSGGSINGHYLRPLGKSRVCHWDCLCNYILDCP